MVEPIVLPGELVYFLFVPIILASIPGVLMFIKRQELTGQKSTISEYNINSMRGDLTEVKGDVKELRKDQSILYNALNTIKILEERVDKEEIKLERHEDALRQIDNIKWRLSVLEQKKSGAV